MLVEQLAVLVGDPFAVRNIHEYRHEAWRQSGKDGDARLDKPAVCLARLGLAHGTEFWPVFRMTAAAAILGYAASSVVDSIWKYQMWGITMKFVFDGVLYGLATAATFAWLWPAAA